MRPLQDLGASATAEQVYLTLVQRGREETASLAARLEENPSSVTAAVSELLDLGLVAVDDERVTPLPPRAAMEVLADRRARAAAVARDSAASLGELWAAHVEGPPYVEMLTTTDAVQAASLAIHEHAVTQVRALSIGPVGRVEIEPEVAPGVTQALQRGVGYRVVYGAQILQEPLAMKAVTACIAHGEEARVFRDVPLNLTIGETYALLMIGAPGTERLHGMVVHASDLYERLVGIFEVFWSLGVPISAGAQGRGSARDQQLLTYLAAGLTDESIARELGVSERTVARRIAALQHLLGAQGRFQLGVQASRRGWL